MANNKKNDGELLKARLFRMDDNTYNMVKKMAFLENRSVSSLLRECVTDKIKTVKKLLTNTDIMI